MHLMLGTRPDLSFAIGQVCRHVQGPTDDHRRAGRHVMCYVKTNIRNNLTFKRNNDLTLRAYVDADWAGDTIDSKSTTGYAICLGETPILWSSVKQKCVAKSS